MDGQPAHFGDPEIALNSGEQQAAESGYRAPGGGGRERVQGPEGGRGGGGFAGRIKKHA